MPRTTFVVDDPLTRHAIHVLGRAPLETILVRTTDVRGEIEVDLDDVTDRPRVAFEAPIESLDTGVPLMNDVMRSDRWLDAATWPAIRFALGRVVAPSVRTRLADGRPLVLAAEGMLMCAIVAAVSATTESRATRPPHGADHRVGGRGVRRLAWTAWLRAAGVAGGWAAS